ncbi:4'-phosphopantetheinyl transferase superfamily protein [Isoptericola halotolerans]|uniref:4'-phosphopantetheinyl transferase family protein n=1 Tax=Isoptericola halotolerans TaxID=300560 RepID=UPI00388ECA20
MSRLLVQVAALPGGRASPGYRDVRAGLLSSVLAAAGLDLGGEAAVLQRRCSTCGGTDHGKPEVPAALVAGWHVSVAHTATRLVVAAADAGPCGVDAEDVDAVGRAPVTAVLLAPEERVDAASVDRVARTWVRKEALLKATGHGLAVDPALLALDAGRGAPQVVRWQGPGPAPVPEVWTEDELPATPAAPRALVSAVALRAP